MKKQKTKRISISEKKLEDASKKLYKMGSDHTIDMIEKIVFQSIKDGYDGMKNTVILEYLKDIRKIEELIIKK